MFVYPLTLTSTASPFSSKSPKISSVDILGRKCSSSEYIPLKSCSTSDNFNLEQLNADYADNPTAFTQEFLPKLQDQFQTTYAQYKGTNVKGYEEIAPSLRSEWVSITGQKADETTAQWKQFAATNDIAERKDIAFAAAAELGTQAYRDQVMIDLENNFGKAGARATGGGSFR